MLVTPAVLPASRKDLDETLALFLRLSASRVQIDVVDGAGGVAPPSWPYSAPGELRAMVQKNETLPAAERIEYEMDLMCADAADAAQDWLALGARRLTLPFAYRSAFARVRDLARKNGAAIGLSIGLDEEGVLLEPYLTEISYVQFMGIAKIGAQGRPFDPRVLERVRAFRAAHPEIPVQVDGGVSLATVAGLTALGVANVVVGSAIVRAADPAAAFREIEATGERARL